MRHTDISSVNLVLFDTIDQRYDSVSALCYRKEGAVEVRSEGEAQQVLQAAADSIHGLGRGGNVPQAPPQQTATAQGRLSCTSLPFLSQLLPQVFWNLREGSHKGAVQAFFYCRDHDLQLVMTFSTCSSL